MEVAFAPGMGVLHPDGSTQPFWDACRRHELVFAACASCGAVRMPPASVCPVCGEAPLTWNQASGLGSVYSFTIARQSFHAQIDDYVPYVVAVIAFDDAPVRLISNVVSVSPEDVHIGLPVQVAWDVVSPEVVIPRFEPRRGSR